MDDSITIKESLEILYELASENLLCDDLDQLDMIDESLQEMAKRQHLAMDTAHNFIVNEFVES